MHLPLTPQTHGLINADNIAKMKKVRRYIYHTYTNGGEDIEE
jgi:phosphoglycerate dehydrogenase-like enzyme